MKFHKDTAQVFIPDGMAESEALARTTHMAVGAHQDDQEIMAFRGILECFQQPDQWLCGVVVTDGSGSPRDGVYARYTDEEMRSVRIIEQKKAAVLGEYGAQVFLDYPSSAVKDNTNRQPVDDLAALLEAAQPGVIYAHNLADKHDTHVAMTLRLIEAIRRLPKEKRPEKLYGCEVWRDLDWMIDTDKVAFDVSAHENLQMALVGVFDSQIAGGKRYDLATQGRRRAHATYLASHGTDATTGTTFAMDLTPLLKDGSLDPAQFALAHVERFAKELRDRFGKLA